MFNPALTLKDLFDIDFPAVWESPVDKPITVKLIDHIAVDRASLLQAFISNNWNSIPNEYRMQGFPRDEHDFFMEAAQLDGEVMLKIAAKTLEHRATAGWMVMAGEVPGLLTFPIHTLIDYQKRVYGMFPEPEDEEEAKKLEPPTFLFGKFIVVPENLRNLVDPENKYFKHYLNTHEELPEVVINFAQFIHEELPDEEE